MERKTEQLKDIALIAHVGSGKTTLAEAMLFNGKSTNRLGNVDDGSSNLDFEPEEIKRRITISSAFHHSEFGRIEHIRFNIKRAIVNIKAAWARSMTSNG